MMKQCAYCHEMLEEDMQFCPNCGAPAPKKAETVKPTPAPQEKTRKTNGFAIAGLVLGILSVFCCCISPIFSILAIVFGAIALPQIAKEKSAGKGMAIIAIVLGSIMLLLTLAGAVYSAVIGEVSYDFDYDDAYEAPYGDYDFFSPFPDFDVDAFIRDIGEI